jgi:hypothetical protein
LFFCIVILLKNYNVCLCSLNEQGKEEEEMKDKEEKTAVALIGSLRDENHGLMLFNELPEGTELIETQKAFELLFWRADSLCSSESDLFMPPFILSSTFQVERLFPGGKPCKYFKLIALSLRNWAKNNEKLFSNDNEFELLVEITINKKEMELGVKQALPKIFFGRDGNNAGELLKLLSKLVDSGIISREQFSRFSQIARKNPQDTIQIVADMILTAIRQD